MNKQKINELKSYRNMLVYIKENYCQNNKEQENEKQKVKILVLRKNFYGRDLLVG